MDKEGLYMQSSNEKLIPIYVLSGFLGSGKTTLLSQMVQYCQAQGLVPAILMNELGEVNLDGQLITKEVAMAEILGGCICCSMRGDLSLELNQLVKQYNPDIIIVESTGAAHPMETIDAITEVSMYQRVELRSVITVIDGEHLLHRSKIGQAATYRLMQDQIRAASLLILNKSDRLHPEEIVEVQGIIRELNSYGQLVTTSHCSLEDWKWLDTAQNVHHASENKANDTAHIQQAIQLGGAHQHNHDHSHVMAYTHYWNTRIDSERFETWLAHLPKEIYRAKGIVTFHDIPSRYLFQFAYRESDFMKIEPQGEVHDVAVFIGEHFDKQWLKEQLLELEQG